MRRTLLVALPLIAVASCQSTLPPHQNSSWACGGIALQQSWSQIQPDIADADQAKRLANAILCLPRTKDVNDYINAHLDEAIQTSSYATGDLEEERDTLTTARARDRFGGYAGSEEFTYHVWMDEGRLQLDAQNEACIATTVLRHGPTGWVVSEYHDACD